MAKGQEELNIELPYNFIPRDYQLPFLEALDEGYKRLVMVWHRRAGKDKTCIAIVPKILLASEKPGLAIHVFPTLKQGREIIWEGRDNDGFRFTDHIPKECRAKEPNESRMSITLTNGSMYRVAGADHPDSLRGGNGTLYILSEWSMHDPMVWYAVIKPIVDQNNGVAIFNFTPLGKNHAFDTYMQAKKNKDWFCQKLTVEDTQTIGKVELDEIRQEYLQSTGDDALFNQEFHCSFDAPVQGSYFGKWMTDAKEEGRITDVKYDRNYKVNTVWDIGVSDATAIWFYQEVGNTVRIIDYYEDRQEDISSFIKVVLDKPYIYGKHIGPHDMRVKDYSAGGLKRFEVARNLGIKFTIPKIKASKEEGVDAARRILPRCYFDKKNCERGIEGLKGYCKKWNDAMKEYSSTPVDSWHRHPADAFKYLGLSVKDNLGLKKKKHKIDFNRIRRRIANPLAGM